jgi:hypothetical protein
MGTATERHNRREAEMAQGIRFNEAQRRYDTDWGWIKLDLSSGDVRVFGPGVNEWFDADKAVRTAGLFSAYAPNLGMAVALAINEQYGAWKGAWELAAMGAAR